jgi:hypothetical protein
LLLTIDNPVNPGFVIQNAMHAYKLKTKLIMTDFEMLPPVIAQRKACMASKNAPFPEMGVRF